MKQREPGPGRLDRALARVLADQPLGGETLFLVAARLARDGDGLREIHGMQGLPRGLREEEAMAPCGVLQRGASGNTARHRDEKSSG